VRRWDSRGCEDDMLLTNEELECILGIAVLDELPEEKMLERSELPSMLE
jgi:hypothetical protein